MTLKGRVYWVIAISVLLIGSVKALAEESTVRAMSPWQGSGQVFKVAPDKLMVLGRFTGIMYLEKQEGVLDAAVMLCPAVHTLNTASAEMQAQGHCIINDGEDNQIYSDWECTGKPGACEGNFTITGGSGRFEGISGGGEMLVRAALAKTAVDLDSGTVVRDAAGLVIWPELKYTLPNP